ncbi:hypothetical protein N3K66_006749 [Trichothecium roseum]|uniref:Uncharacterized protein n=1 Tax=Trichothecium roseum TaxID=47278 RepID=A0ACC0UWN2_9HYPO|nr:hypothetical protein N3K66_006749 [Trichothecium roseum]
MAQNRHWEQDKEATVYIGNIDERATPAMVYEVMLQMGPIHNIHMPRDRVTQSHQGFGFVEFRSPQDAEYAANVVNGVKLFGKSLRVNKASADRGRPGGGPGGGGAGADVGAELFVGNLDPAADERLLYDTFSRFGPLLCLPKVARGDNGGESKGFGFVSFADFESSDAAIANLHGQYILSKDVSVQYAFKKDGKGERHGDEAERQLAAEAKSRNIIPESQPIPQAFLAPPAGHAPPAAPPSAAAPSAPPPVAAPMGYDSVPPGFAPPSMAQPPPHAAPPPGFGGMPPRGPSPYSAGASTGAPPPRAPLGPGAAPLPPPPSGLPARPPQSQGSYTNPADFHPGFRGPTGSPAPPQGFPTPPPGFGPPPGVAGGPQAPPPGFPPPPGFQQQGYNRR